MSEVVFATCLAATLLLLLSPLSEVLAIARRHRGAAVPAADFGGEPVPKLLFLVPAHNEATLIGDCVRSVLGMDYPAARRRVVVVADNCSDETAEVAEAAGAECLQRHDEFLLGKPHAIGWAMGMLDIAEWDACIILDADSVVDTGFGLAVARRRPLRERIVQTYFGMLNEGDNWLTQLGSVLTRIRYEILYPLKNEAGLNCPLTGNGVCVGTGILQLEGWTSFSLTENWELYARSTALGRWIDYTGDARLYSQEASSLGQAVTQRRRWLAGRIWVVKRYSWPLLSSKKIGWHQKLDAFAELAGPSPVIHLVLAMLVIVGATASIPGPRAVGLSVAALASLLPMGVHAAMVITRSPDRWALLRACLMLPIYAVWRVGIAGYTLATLRDRRWRKTDRGP